jgi:FKBP-type peptidyl-prolyl cis-trans isomerase
LKKKFPTAVVLTPFNRESSFTNLLSHATKIQNLFPPHKDSTMKLKYSLLVGAGFLVGTAAVAAYNLGPPAAADAQRRTFVSTAAATAAATVWGRIPRAGAADNDDDMITTESGLQYKVITPGTGAIPAPGQTVKTQYTGWLKGFDSDQKFDSSRDRGRPFTFTGR